MKMSLEQWDREVSPFLRTICIRAGWIASDARQIAEWVNVLPAVPGFETEARDRLDMIKRELMAAMKTIDVAIANYNGKEKMK